jgi:alanine racemase
VTITLSVRTALWRSHVARIVNAVDGLVPVVKGNGYGFGRVALARLAAEFTDTVAVGTVHELDGLPAELHPVVLTPTLRPPETTDPILTVGAPEHVDALGDWSGRVIVKLASSMRRYGRGPELIDTARTAGLDVVGVSIHPPLAGRPDDHRLDVERAIADVDPSVPVWVSHLDADNYAALPPTHRYRLRLGTSLWHGDKSFLHLGTDVLDVRPVRAGQPAGYRQHPVAADGHLVMIGAGTANGVTELADGRSPFHHQRRRLALHEPPHMHTSMVFVAAGEPVPGIGARVDLQRPLTTTLVDEYEWR